MSHYYMNDPNLKSDPILIQFTYRGGVVKFRSDAGVFSKAKVDFGTALLLESLPADLNGKRILDVGCGYGAIGLSVAKANPGAAVEMIDVNRRALGLAEANAAENGIRNARIYESDLFGNVDSEFDFIISNPPVRAGKAVVHGIVDGAFRHLEANGELWMVIQKKQGAPSLYKKIEEVFGNAETVARAKGYHVFRARKL